MCSKYRNVFGGYIMKSKRVMGIVLKYGKIIYLKIYIKS